MQVATVVPDHQRNSDCNTGELAHLSLLYVPILASCYSKTQQINTESSSVLPFMLVIIHKTQIYSKLNKNQGSIFKQNPYIYIYIYMYIYIYIYIYIIH